MNCCMLLFVQLDNVNILFSIIKWRSFVLFGCVLQASPMSKVVLTEVLFGCYFFVSTDEFIGQFIQMAVLWFATLLLKLSPQWERAHWGRGWCILRQRGGRWHYKASLARWRNQTFQKWLRIPSSFRSATREDRQRPAGTLPWCSEVSRLCLFSRSCRIKLIFNNTGGLGLRT